ncbi:MAG: hypothetical protein V3S48_04720 [Candidatus Neomarinimicrobiota bacterium]
MSFVGLIAGAGEKAESLKRFLQSPDGVQLQVEIRQKQFEQQNIITGTIEILALDKYLFDSENETIVVQGSTVRTWNKQTRQLILDGIIKGEFNLFQLLTGNFKGVEFTKSSRSGDLTKLNYEIKTMGFNGYITFDSESGRPVDLTMYYSPDQSFKITITGVSTLKRESLFNSFAPDALEVIDLRE